jgi:putative flippase GtrA
MILTRRGAALAELMRFGAVGAGTTLIYGALGLTLTTLGWRAGLASIIAYGVSTACSYAGHRFFTFATQGGTQQVSRFLVVNGVGLAVALTLPPAFVAMGFDGRWGVVAACVAIPLSNYFALKHLVFAVPAAARA